MQWSQTKNGHLRNTFSDYLSLRAGSLVGKGGGAATASRRSRREEWDEEKENFSSAYSPRRLAVAALARDTLPKQQLVSLLAGYDYLR